jgi:hypothetical protein
LMIGFVTWTVPGSTLNPFTSVPVWPSPHSP